MKEDLLKDFKEEYQSKLKEKEDIDKRLDTLMNRKTIMENSPMVRDYIELCKQIEKEKENVYSESEVFVDTLCDFEEKGLMDKTNDILLYVGSFYTEFGYAKSVNRNNPDAEFDKYVDIESYREFDVPVEDRESFENTHKVIFADENIVTRYTMYEIRDEFVYDSLLEGQETACKKILSRYKKN